MPNNPDGTKGGEPGGAHSFSNTANSVEEATKHQLELNRISRETPGSIEYRAHQKLLADLEEIRVKKAKRKARNRYDFS